MRAGEKVLHRLGEDVREVVADELERFAFVPCGNQRKLRVAFERPHDIADLAIDLRGQRGLGEPRPDRRGDIRRGRALGHFLHRAVGKRDFEHLRHYLGHVARGARTLNWPPRPTLR